MQTRTTKLLKVYWITLPATSFTLNLHHARAMQQTQSVLCGNPDVQEALKYGRFEKANSGPDGSPRLIVTHKGTVYLVDERTRREVASWRMDDALLEQPAWMHSPKGFTTHTIVVVDASGSMRKNDIPGYKSRTEAVYDCLERDLIEPQLRLSQSPGAGSAFLSLIEMGEHASVAFERQEVGEELQVLLRGKKLDYKSGASHGHYISALDSILDLQRNSPLENVEDKIFIVFLSDGAPSDHISYVCSHHISPYTSFHDRRFGLEVGRECRAALQRAVRRECVERVQKMGDLCGRNRLRIATIAFGPPVENYQVLKDMAKELPNGHFSKLGLNAGSLRTAFSSLTSSLTMLRSHTGALSSGLTERCIEKEVADQDEETDWWVYVHSHDHPWAGLNGNAVILKKQRYDRVSEEFVDVPLEHGSEGVAHSRKMFAHGAERFCFRCYEFKKDAESRQERVGPVLVAKESRYEEHLVQSDFHKTFCRVQEKAIALAVAFNRRCGGPDAWKVSYLSPIVYTVREDTYPNGIAYIWCEPKLDGVYEKW